MEDRSKLNKIIDEWSPSSTISTYDFLVQTKWKSMKTITDRPTHVSNQNNAAVNGHLYIHLVRDRKELVLPVSSSLFPSRLYSSTKNWRSKKSMHASSLNSSIIYFNSQCFAPKKVSFRWNEKATCLSHSPKAVTTFLFFSPFFFGRPTPAS